MHFTFFLTLSTVVEKISPLHYQSFIGRDFKALAQIALFLLTLYMTEQEKVVWLSLSKVHMHTFLLFCLVYNSLVTLGV